MDGLTVVLDGERDRATGETHEQRRRVYVPRDNQVLRNIRAPSENSWQTGIVSGRQDLMIDTVAQGALNVRAPSTGYMHSLLPIELPEFECRCEWKLSTRRHTGRPPHQ